MSNLLKNRYILKINTMFMRNAGSRGFFLNLYALRGTLVSPHALWVLVFYYSVKNCKPMSADSYSDLHYDHKFPHWIDGRKHIPLPNDHRIKAALPP
jgi:hypothetical protein